MPTPMHPPVSPEWDDGFYEGVADAFDGAPQSDAYAPDLSANWIEGFEAGYARIKGERLPTE